MVAWDYEQMEARCHRLAKLLKSLSSGELKDFNGHFQNCMVALDKPFFREVAKTVRGDLDEDSFRSFQATIVSMGEKIYTEFLKDIQIADRIRFKKVEFFAGVYANLARNLYYEKTSKWPIIKKVSRSKSAKPTVEQQKQLKEIAKGYMASELDSVGRRKKSNNELRAQIAKMKAERLALVDTGDIKKAQELFNESQKSIGHGKKTDALTALTKAIQLNPVYAEAFKRRGDVHLSSGDLSAAIADYTRAIEINPYFAAAYESRAEAKVKSNDLREGLYDRAKHFVLAQALGDGASSDGDLLNRLTIDTTKTFTAMDLRNYRGQKLPLAYSFTILNEADARSLMIMVKDRLNCASKVRSVELPGCPYWIVYCSTAMEINDSGDLFDWIYSMINLGREFGSVNDSWGFELDKFFKLKPNEAPVIELPPHIDEDDKEAVEAFMEEAFQREMEEEEARGLPEGHILLSYQYWYAEAWFYLMNGPQSMVKSCLVNAIEFAGEEEDVKARALADKDFQKAWPMIEKLEVKSENGDEEVKATELGHSLEFDEYRTQAVAALEKVGLELFSHFESVEYDEENAGISVLGIKEEKHVRKIAKVLRQTFSEWKNEESEPTGDDGWNYCISDGGD